MSDDLKDLCCLCLFILCGIGMLLPLFCGTSNDNTQQDTRKPDTYVQVIPAPGSNGSMSLFPVIIQE